MSFYGPDIDLKYIEKAILLEDIIIPELPTFPTMEQIEAGNVFYPRAEELYSDTKGKFHIPILMPLCEITTDVTDTTVPMTARNILNKDCNLEVTDYTESNYLELTIPKYIMLNFLNKVPAGTMFLVCFIGGSLDTEDIKIIGVDPDAVYEF